MRIVDQDLNGAVSHLWAQYYTWGIGVSIGNAERFVAEPDDHNGYWQRSYANALTDLQFIEQSDNPHYRGIAKVFKAYVYQGLVDHFGDVPYSEALKGEDQIFTPSYDNAADIYTALSVVVVVVVVALLEFGEIGSEIGDDDLMYQGDITKWCLLENKISYI